MKLTANAIDKVREKLAAKCKYDPLLFAEKAWDWGRGTLTDRDIRVWQSEVLDELAAHLSDPKSRHRVFRAAVASGHGIGKSALTGMLTTWALACYKDPRIIITANTEGQLLTKTSPEVQQWIRSSVYGDLFNLDTLSYKLKSNPVQHRADLVTNSENNPEAFAGLHAEGRLVMVLVDEASILPDIIYSTILGALTDENTVLIFIMLGNPTSAFGQFREAFRKNRKFWKTWNVDSRDVEGTDKEYLQQLLDEFGENSDQAKIRVKGQFPAASQKQFFETPLIDAAYGRHLRKEQYDFAPVILTCDPAWEGDDKIVIGLRQGLKFEILDVMEKNNNDTYLAAKLANYETRHKADAVFIDAGYGTGIYSAGTTMGREWRLVWFGEAADDAGYKNKRAEMYGRTRAWLAAGGAVPKEQRLYDDLVSIETKPNDNGIIQLKPKQQMKKDGLPSPDYADSLALTFAYDVKKKLPDAVKVMDDNVGHVHVEEVYEPH